MNGPLDTTADVSCPAEEVTFIAAPFTSSTAATNSISLESSCDVLMLSPPTAEDRNVCLVASFVSLLLVTMGFAGVESDLDVRIVEYDGIRATFFPLLDDECIGEIHLCGVSPHRPIRGYALLGCIW